MIRLMSILKKVLHKLKKIRDLQLIGSSGYFDKDWYLKNNPDVAQAKVDPLLHYLHCGGFERRDPGPRFSSRYYLRTYDDVKKSGINPLVHYLKYGRNEGRNPRGKDPYQKFLYWTENGSHFSIPNRAIINQFRATLKNEDDSQVKIVQRDGKLWVIKNCRNNELIERELLVYSLAKGLVNAAEVKTLSFQNCKELLSLGLLHKDASPYNTILVRMAQDYSIGELPLKNLDSAMAGEFVFSLWVRRHDINEDNRAYSKEGIPVFFDLNASLNNEPELVAIDQFFANSLDGYPGRWRVRERGKIPLNTLASRESNDGYRYDFIDSIDGFKDAAEKITEKIILHEFELKNLVEKAGYMDEEIDELTSFIATTKKTLSDDVKKMLKVIFYELP